MLICKKGVFNGNVFVSEEGEKYEIVNLWTPNPTKRCISENVSGGKTHEQIQVGYVIERLIL